ncbi:MAG: AAA family ATPase [Candidatus Nanoarchaeia archaeon]
MIKKIKLQNWKSHTETELSFTKGINVLVGPMGSGKSSVLQGICFALFGSVPEVRRKELKVSELVRRNAGSQAAVELEFETGDKAFKVMRVIGNKGTEAIVTDADGIMLAGTNPTQATAFLKEILKLDEDTFLRTVYAKQNEIDLFLQLNPGERKTRLDELMNLHKFEAARKNCVALVNKLFNKQKEKENFLKGFELESLQSQISTLENEISLLVDEKQQIGHKLVEAQKAKLDAESELKEVKKKFDFFARLEEQQKILLREINEIRLKIKGPLKSQVELKMQLDELQNKISAFENRRFELNKAIDRLNKELMLSEKERCVVESKLSDIVVRLEKISAYKLELEQLTKQTGVENLKEEYERLEKEIKELDKEIVSCESEIRLLQKHLAELKSAVGVCPTCTRELEAATKEKLISERETVILQLVTKTENLKESKKGLEEQKDKIQELLDEVEALLREINEEAELQKQQANLKNILETASNTSKRAESDIEKFRKELESVEFNLTKLRKDETQLREELHLAQLKEKQQQYEQQLAEIQAKLATKPDSSTLETAEFMFKAKLREYEELLARHKSLDYVVEEKNKRLAELMRKKKQSEDLAFEIAKLQKQIEFLQQLKNSLLIAQEMLRKQLIETVNEVMSQLWSKLYPYTKFTSVRLEASDTDYTLQLRTSQGDWINVAGFASGGERMLAALVLRLAFAKVLAPEFNILILDEPTHNLDDAAISMLMLALQEHLSQFLEQLFIVTHDEKLAEVGHNIIRLT